MFVLLQVTCNIKADNRHDDSNKDKKPGVSKEEPAVQSLAGTRKLQTPYEAKENESDPQREQEITKRHYTGCPQQFGPMLSSL